MSERKRGFIVRLPTKKRNTGRRDMGLGNKILRKRTKSGIQEVRVDYDAQVDPVKEVFCTHSR